MTHPFLLDPDRARAYQILCDCPSGTVRSWAGQAGWTRQKLSRFLQMIEELGLAKIERLGNYGSVFRPCEGGVRPVPPRPAASRGVPPVSSAVVVNQLDKVPRYGEALDLILVANRELTARGWEKIPEDNLGSRVAATKMLKVVPLDRAVPLLETAIRIFNPSATGGEPLRSLGHPFITKYVINEYRRIERELARGQLSLLFVERTSPPAHVYGARKQDVDDRPPAKPETIVAGVEEFRRVANSNSKPERMR